MKRVLWTIGSLGLALLGGMGVQGLADDAPPAGAAVQAAREFIRQDLLRMHLSFIASDELEGRNTPSRGLDVAARYLSTHMQFYGFQPGGDEGSFYQKMKIVTRKTSAKSAIKVQAGDQSVELAFGKDFVGSASDAKGDLVFAGYGLSAESLKYDDFAGVDVKDKVVVVLDGVPPGLDAAAFQVERKVGNRTFRIPVNRNTKWIGAQSRGAVGMLSIMNADYTSKTGTRSQFEADLAGQSQPTETYEFMDRASGNSPFGGGRGRPAGGIAITAEAGDRLAKAIGLDVAQIRAKVAETKQPVAATITGKAEIDFELDVTDTKWTQNVVAKLEGSDPKLKDEYVAFSAHYDHVGTRVAGQGAFGQIPGGAGAQTDLIYNGADDDGSGTVAILTIAEAFSRMARPKRSLLFVWHAGEERGLIGSSYLTDHNPPVPLEKIAALINIDMIGRNWKDDESNKDHCFLVGTKQTSTDLDDLIRRVNGTRLRLDPVDPENLFMRSDHYMYARRGVPIAFLCTGTHKDYHRPSDHVEAILFEKYEQITELAFECGLELANSDSRPKFSGNVQ